MYKNKVLAGSFKYKMEMLTYFVRLGIWRVRALVCYKVDVS